MNKTSLNIQVLYNEMGKSEKRIADWILKHPGEIISLSIVELAEQCGCSEATIVRFSKRLGLSGYQELKISLAAESGSEMVSTSITAEDSVFEMYEKVCNDIYRSLELTKKSLDEEKFSLAAQTILNSDKIVIFGLGNSASVALDASHKFLRSGLNAVAYSDNHMQMIAASHLRESDTVIAISHSGSSKDIVDALTIAKVNKAHTITITNRGKSPILKYTDIALFTSSAETQHSILALNSRIAQLAIIDALYFYVVYHGSPETLSHIRDTEQALMSKKY